MRCFTNILVVHDSETDNRALLDRAVRLARKNQASLTMVDIIEGAFHEEAKLISPEAATQAPGPAIHILEELPWETPFPPAPVSPADVSKPVAHTGEDSTSDIQEFIIWEQQRSLVQSVAAIQQAGVQVSCKTLYGTPFLEIIREVLRSQHDLVMITAEGRGGLGEMLFGSTTMHLMRKCPCPVWVIKPGKPQPYSRILAAVDPATADQEHVALNTTIMELATSLARLEQSELLIVHTWTMYGEARLRSGRANLSKEAVDRLLRETQDAHRQRLIKLLQRHPLKDLKCEVYLLKGEAGRLIPQLAQAKEVELIIMGTVNRAGIAGLLIGNTAEKGLRQVDCSTLAAKPEGFITPVLLDSV